MDAIYICHTPYHVLVAAAKTLLSSQNVSVLLIDTIPDVDNLAARLEQAGIFDTVRVAGVGRPFYSQSYYRTLLHDLFFKQHVQKLINHIAGHQEIYLFNDISEIGCLLMRRGIKYHLLEDGLDAFKLFNQRQLSSGKTLARSVLRQLFRTPQGLGDSDCCVDIEINDAEGLRTKIDKPIKVVSRKSIFSSLNKEQLEALFSIFQLGNYRCLHGKTLVLTTPFRELGYDDEAIHRYYRTIVRHFGGPEQCWIKPHPRDGVDYSAIVNPDNIIDRRMPVELLSFIPSLKLHAVVSYNSTSLGAVQNSDYRFVTKPGLIMRDVENLCIEI